MKKLALFALLITTSVTFSACNQSSTTPAGNTDTPAAQEKSGDTTMTGKVTQAGQTFFLEKAGKTPTEISSYTVDLNNYVGYTVTVTGQYSGNTLFINKIQQQ